MSKLISSPPPPTPLFLKLKKPFFFFYFFLDLAITTLLAFPIGLDIMNMNNKLGH